MSIGSIDIGIFDKGAPTAATDTGPVERNARADGLPSNLSLDDLMGWLQTSLDQTDADLRQKMAGMGNSKKVASEIGDAMTELQTIARSAEVDGWVKDPALVKKVQDFMATHKDIIPSLSAAGQAALQHLQAACVMSATLTPMTTPGGPVTETHLQVHKDDLTAAVDALKQEATSISSSNELEMIGLQSAVALRGRNIEMISNIMHSMNETAKGVVGNFR
ncbi:MAG: hypothetical protein NVS3B10_17320 [Polyangiales bacterium]